MFRKLGDALVKFWHSLRRKDEKVKQKVEAGKEAQNITINVSVKK